MDASESIFVDGKNEIVLAPTCPRCENEPKYLVTRRSTGERYWYSLGPDCESTRQAAKRMAKKPVAVETSSSIEDGDDEPEEVSPIGEPTASELPKNTLVLSSPTQVELWEQEIVGQLSDGMWENTSPMNHWKPWSDATAIVGGVIGRNFYARKTGYGLHNLLQIEEIRDRMIAMGEKHEGETYDLKQLRKDLTTIKTAMKTSLL